MTESVKFKCPDCGKEWTEEQDTEDDWFKLATTQTLCDECSKGLIIHRKEPTAMPTESITVEFSGDDLDMILLYQKVSGATTVQNAIMNAVSLALDHADD